MSVLMMFVFCLIPFIISDVMSQEGMCTYLPEGLHSCLGFLGNLHLLLEVSVKG